MINMCSCNFYNVPAYSFSKGKVQKENQNNPGPGHYDYYNIDSISNWINSAK